MAVDDPDPGDINELLPEGAEVRAWEAPDGWHNVEKGDSTIETLDELRSTEYIVVFNGERYFAIRNEDGWDEWEDFAEDFEAWNSNYEEA